jgi:hypothetical protein
MPEFLAETYAPRGAPGAAAPRAADIALGAGQASPPGAPVRFLGAILVPDEETCFWLYQAPSADAVHAAMTPRPAAARADYPGRSGQAARGRPGPRIPYRQHHPASRALTCEL